MGNISLPGFDIIPAALYYFSKHTLVKVILYEPQTNNQITLEKINVNFCNL